MDAEPKPSNGDRRALVRVGVRAGFVGMALIVYLVLTVSFMHFDREWSDSEIPIIAGLITAVGMWLGQAASYYFRGSDEEVSGSSWASHWSRWPSATSSFACRSRSVHRGPTPYFSGWPCLTTPALAGRRRSAC